MKTKHKNTLWLVSLVIVSLLAGIGIQGVLYIQQRNQSILRAADACNDFITATEEKVQLLIDEDSSFAESLEVNSEKKEERRESLKNLDLLILVNPWNSIPDGYPVQPAYVDEFAPELYYTNEGEMMDVRCVEALARMMQDCVAAGNSPYICSAYRSHEKQVTLFENKIDRVMAEGYGYDEAKKMAAKVVAVPGTSEHELGLSADIIDANYPYLVPEQEQMPAQQWLAENSWKYGFILRYPNDKSDITGIIYEPWHYRYVGEEFAKDMHEKGVCLEEYVKLRRGR